MTVAWADVQRARVEAILDAHPTDRGDCVGAARLLLPIATSLDPSARPRIVEPDPRIAPGAMYVDPARGWSHHVTVEVQAHHVDALTGAEGHRIDGYLARYFPDTFAALRIDDVDLARDDL